MRHPLETTGLRRGHVVTALVAIVVVAAAIAALLQRSEIDNLKTKSGTLAAGKATAIQQRDAVQRGLDAAQRALDDRAAQKAAEEEEEQRIEALRPRGATLFAAKCASCHGREGGGGFGPRLSGGAAANHLSAGAAAAFVSNGALDPMPRFDQSLSPAQIKQVVAYMLNL